MPKRDVEYIISLQDKFSKRLDRIEGKVNKFGGKLKGIGKSALRMGAALTGGFAAFSVVSKAFNTIADFEKGVSNLSAITGATGEDLKFLSDKAIELGGSTTKSALQVVNGFKLIASAKPELLEDANALALITKEVITLGEAADITLEQAATSLTDIMNQFGAKAGEASRFINTLAAGSKFGAASIPLVADAVKEFGVAAADANISIEETTSLVEILAEKGQKGSRAGNALKNVLLRLASGADDTNPKIVGLQKAFENLEKQQLSVTQVEKKFGRENFLQAKILIDNASSIDTMTKKLTGTKTAYEQARINTNNLRGDMDRLSSSWEKFVLGLNQGDSEISRFSRSIIQSLTKIVDKFSEVKPAAEKALEPLSKENLFVDNLKEANLEQLKELRRIGAITTNQYKAFRSKFLKAQLQEARAVQKLLKQLGAEDIADMRSGAKKSVINSISRVVGGVVGLPTGATSGIPPKAATRRSIPPSLSSTQQAKSGLSVSKVTAQAPKNFIINLDSLIESFTVNASSSDGSLPDIKRKVTQTILDALNDVSLAANI